jgi:hypothetical protein
LLEEMFVASRSGQFWTNFRSGLMTSLASLVLQEEVAGGRLEFHPEPFGNFQQTWGSQNESAAHRALLTLCGFWYAQLLGVLGMRDSIIPGWTAAIACVIGMSPPI